MTSVPLLVLIGPPGAGKTRVGRRVAKLLGAEFVDTDRRIVAAHGPVGDIFESQGERAFRVIERDIVAQALEENAVVSLGGGAVLDPQTQAMLATQRVVLLTVNADAVAKRIGGQKRPLLADDTRLGKIEVWQRLVDARRGVYEQLATKTWDTSWRPIDQIAREIADWVTTETAETRLT